MPTLCRRAYRRIDDGRAAIPPGARRRRRGPSGHRGRRRARGRRPRAAARDSTGRRGRPLPCPGAPRAPDAPPPRLPAPPGGEEARARALAQDALVSNARLVHVGTAFAWGDHGSSWIDEGTPQRPAPLGAGDADVARHLLALREERGLDVVFVALGLVYGPGGLFERALLDPRARVVGWGGNYLSCVHVDDAARAVAAALARGAPGMAYLAVDDEPVTQRLLADAAADAAGRPRPGTASLGLAGARVGFPLARSLAASQRVRNARAKAELGWAPRFPTVRDGVWTALPR